MNKDWIKCKRPLKKLQVEQGTEFETLEKLKQETKEKWQTLINGPLFMGQEVLSKLR